MKFKPRPVRHPEQPRLWGDHHRPWIFQSRLGPHLHRV